MTAALTAAVLLLVLVLDWLYSFSCDAFCCRCISACISERLCLCLCLQASVTWDENKIYGCVCDSAWEVGYGPGQTQATQWFGADCSLKRCPSGNDPRTSPLDETDCEW